MLPLGKPIACRLFSHRYFPFKGHFLFYKYVCKSFICYPYLTWDATAKFRRHLPNMKVPFDRSGVFRWNRKMTKINELDKFVKKSTKTCFENRALSRKRTGGTLRLFVVHCKVIFSCIWYLYSCYHLYIEGILPKGPYLLCVSMAGRALLAG